MTDDGADRPARRPRRLLSDPEASPVVQRTLVQVTHTRQGNFSATKLRRLVADASAMTGLPQWRIAVDAARSKGGRVSAPPAVSRSADHAGCDFVIDNAPGRRR